MEGSPARTGQTAIPGDRPGPDMAIKGYELLQQELCRRAESGGMNAWHGAAVQEARLRDRLQGHIDSWVTGKSSQRSLQIPTCPHFSWGEGATCRFPSLLGLEMACCAANVSHTDSHPRGMTDLHCNGTREQLPKTQAQSQKAAFQKALSVFPLTQQLAITPPQPTPRKKH